MTIVYLRYMRPLITVHPWQSPRLRTIHTDYPRPPGYYMSAPLWHHYVPRYLTLSMVKGFNMAVLPKGCQGRCR